MYIKEFIKYTEQECRLGKNIWAVPRLIELSRHLPIMTIPLAHMNMYHIYEELTMRQLVGHIKAVLETDLNYPIILDEDGDLMDGRHRLMRAILENKESIKAVRFEKNPYPCRRIEE